MDSIEKMLNAFDRDAKPQELARAVDQLRQQFEEYEKCCCRRAHVIPIKYEQK